MDDAKAEQVRLLHRLKKEIGNFGDEPMLKRLRRWHNVRSPNIRMVQIPYCKEWADAFTAEAREIAEVLGRCDVEIHHFGSSSIPGMVSKPILDIAVAVPDGDALARSEVERCLLSLGYTAWGESPIAEGTQWFWQIQSDGMQRVVHVCAIHDGWLAGALNFRDYLRAFPEKRAMYESAKQQLAVEQDTNIAIYTLRKTLLMYSIIVAANVWREHQNLAG